MYGKVSLSQWSGLERSERRLTHDPHRSSTGAPNQATVTKTASDQRLTTRPGDV